MDWSLILPTRERLDLLEGLLSSLRATTVRPDLLEVWIAVDDDDEPTVMKIPGFMRDYPFTRFLCVPRQGNMSVGYYNRMARLTQGRYIMALNDDVRFVTSGWDRVGIAALEKFQAEHPDGVCYGKADDGLKMAYGCFPVLSRQAYFAMGWVFHPEFTSWGADINLHAIMSRVARVVDLPFHLLHLSHHTGLRTRDAINERVGQIANYNYACAEGESMRLRDIMASWQVYGFALKNA